MMAVWCRPNMYLFLICYDTELCIDASCPFYCVLFRHSEGGAP